VVDAALVDTDRAVAIDARVAVPACGVRCLLRDWLRLLPVVAAAAQTPTARGGQAEQTEGKRSEALEAWSAARRDRTRAGGKWKEGRQARMQGRHTTTPSSSGDIESRSAERAGGRRPSTFGGRRPHTGSSTAENGKDGKSEEDTRQLVEHPHRAGAHREALHLHILQGREACGGRGQPGGARGAVTLGSIGVP